MGSFYITVLCTTPPAQRAWQVLTNVTPFPLQHSRQTPGNPNLKEFVSIVTLPSTHKRCFGQLLQEEL